LSILVPVFKEIAKNNPNVHLDVFSSFKIYGWEEADKQFEPLYDQIRNHPQMTYHGFVPNEQLKEYLKTAHIHAYPCIWTETSCRAMLEAMSAGLLCVHPNLGALPETSGSLNYMYHGDADLNKHAKIFWGALENAIKVVRDEEEYLKGYLSYVKHYVDQRYNVNKIAAQWEEVLTDLNKRYDTPEKRGFQKQMFTYKVGQ
jgi:glycosyltransferase involved in cell wall biosynthesis